MISFTLKQLRYAVAVTETGHFGRAAERCAITQPALSQQIQSLEAACGTAIFDRLATGAQLTPFGRDFIAHARNVLNGVEHLSQFAAAHRGRPTRAVRFGLIPTVAPYLLPDIFPALQSGLPEVSFAVSENRTDALVDALAEGTLDLALIATDPRSRGPKLTLSPLFTDDFVLATAGDDSACEPVRLGTLDTSRMLLLDEGHCFRDQALAACGLSAETASKTFAATSLSTIVEFVANGQGITLLPEIALKKETAGDRIRIRRLAAPGAGRLLSLCWREATPFTALFETIAAIIRGTRAQAV
jgi:LysR family hydrogen peroxide-inducible transcriptional activator